MANVYVYSGAAGAGTGADWANAYTTLAVALAAKAAGDDFWVAQDHAETTAGALTFTSPGTAAAPCRIFCVSRAGSVPPVAADLLTTATVTTTGNNGMTFAGFAYCYGITFNCGTTAVTPTLAFNSQAAWWWKLDTCALAILATGGSIMAVGATANNDDNLLELVNATIRLSASNQNIAIRSPMAWRGGSLLGTAPTTLFTPTANSANASLRVEGVDLSLCAGSSTLYQGSAGAYGSVLFQNCKLAASVTVSSAPAGQGGALVDLINCDSGATNNRFYRRRFQGEVFSETTIVRSGGATDGATPYSRKMTTSANAKIIAPLESAPMLFWVDSLTLQTVSIPTVTDNVTLKDTEAWVEVDYLGTSGFPQQLTASDRASTILTTGADQTADTASTWTTTGLTTPVKQVLSTTFTPTLKGFYRARVMLAKASTTMYFDPKVDGGSARQYPTEGGTVNNPVRHYKYKPGR